MSDKLTLLPPDNRATVQPNTETEPESTPESPTSETPEQLWEYAEAILPPRRRKRANQPVELPVLV